jgi:SWI/SNF-related matrix-associated actin-dependent regulator 1 of chromatin subfamily A
MQIFFDSGTGRYEAKATFDDRLALKSAGFWWDPDKKCWYTAKAEIAARLQEVAEYDQTARDAIEGFFQEMQENIEASHAADADIDIPHPEGFDYKPFQRAGIAWAIKHKQVLIADEMGLGKTIQALGTINADETIHSAVIVCPLSVALNWRKEAQRWLTRPMTIGVATGKLWPKDADIVIVHWAIVARHTEALRERNWDMIVLDESHYAKEPRAKRSMAIFGNYRSRIEPLEARYKLALSGTPVPNRPIEAYGVLHWLDKTTFKSWADYAKRYCAAKQTPYGWDVSGHSNLAELQEKMRRSVMIRRLKADVLTELPPKVRQVILIDSESGEAKKAVESERRVLAASKERREKAMVAVELAKAASPEEYEAAVRALHDVDNSAFTEISRVRHETALAKVPDVIAHLQDLLDGGIEKIVVFAHHRDVIAQLHQGLTTTTKTWEGVKTVGIVGGDAPEDRENAVTAFQNDPDVRVFIGSIGATREGITLTKASIAVFAELDWVPGNLNQAEDRIHRIGQTDSVLIQHLLIDGSIDAKMSDMILAKQAVIEQQLDKALPVKDAPQLNAITPEGAQSTDDPHKIEKPTSHSASADMIAARAAYITEEEIAQVHRGLQELALNDWDHAREENSIGFNRLDVSIGHQLAERPVLTPKQAVLGSRILVKYRGQVGEEVASVWATLGKRLKADATEDSTAEEEDEDEVSQTTKVSAVGAMQF